MKLNLDFKVVSPEGQEIQASDILASALAHSDKGDAIKVMKWANALFKKEEIEIDKQDREFLLKFVQDSQTKNFAKAPILEALYDLKD